MYFPPAVNPTKKPPTPAAAIVGGSLTKLNVWVRPARLRKDKQSNDYQ